MPFAPASASVWQPVQPAVWKTCLPAVGSPVAWGVVGTVPTTVFGRGETVLPPEQPARTSPQAARIRAPRRTRASLLNGHGRPPRKLRRSRRPGRRPVRDRAGQTTASAGMRASLVSCAATTCRASRRHRSLRRRRRPSSSPHAAAREDEGEVGGHGISLDHQPPEQPPARAAGDDRAHAGCEAAIVERREGGSRVRHRQVDRGGGADGEQARPGLDVHGGGRGRRCDPSAGEGGPAPAPATAGGEPTRQRTAIGACAERCNLECYDCPQFPGTIALGSRCSARGSLSRHARRPAAIPSAVGRSRPPASILRPRYDRGWLQMYLGRCAFCVRRPRRNLRCRGRVDATIDRTPWGLAHCRY